MGIKAKERLLTVLIIVAIAGLLFVVGYPIYKESLPSHVRFGVDKSLNSLPFYVALMDTTRDYFALEKVEAEFVDITGDPLEGVKNGDYDIAVVPWYWLIISPSTDGDTVKAFGSVEIRSSRSMDAFFVPEGSKISRLRDLSGKRIGYLSRDEYLVNLLMAQLAEALELKQVKYVSMSAEQLMRAFEDKTADVLFVLEPYRSYLLYTGAVALAEGLLSAYVVPTIPYGAIVMRKNFVTVEHRTAATRVKKAVEAALSHMARNPELAKRLLLQLNSMPGDGEIITGMRAAEYQRLSEISVKNIENLQTELVKRGIGTCGIKPTEFLFQKIDFGM